MEKELVKDYREVESYPQNFEVIITHHNSVLFSIVKRSFDVIASSVVLIILAPIILLFMLAIRLESKGSPIYKQERLGKNGKRFVILKLRSMRIDAEENGAKWAEKNDERVTRIGSFIRKVRIDELPQLINIIIGDMSIVGPRPEREFFTNRFEKEIPGFVNRLQMRPGLTGLAQVNGGYDISAKKKLAYDMEYIQNKSLLLDLKIILKTIKVIFTCDGAR